MDEYSREILAFEIGQSIGGKPVVAVMNRIASQRGAPQRIRADNGSESRVTRPRPAGFLHQVTLGFSRPVKPTDNALVESFKRRLRDECFNMKLVPLP